MKLRYDQRLRDAVWQFAKDMEVTASTVKRGEMVRDLLDAIEAHLARSLSPGTATPAAVPPPVPAETPRPENCWGPQWCDNSPCTCRGPKQRVAAPAETGDVELVFADLDALAQRYYTGAVLRWREYREKSLARIRTALASSVPGGGEKG